jgi:hypoxanthine phosphoribosyltransferase
VKGVSVLLDTKCVDDRIHELAVQIAAEETVPPVILGILNGAAPFMMALLRALPADYGQMVDWDFVDASSYQGTTSTGQVQVDRMPKLAVVDRPVLLVDGIIDTGKTVEAVMAHLQQKGARHIRVATLLDKPSRRQVEVPVDYRGFLIDDVFVVGCGMDWDQRYRNLPYIGVVDEATVCP